MGIGSQITSIFQTAFHIQNFGANYFLVQDRYPVVLSISIPHNIVSI